MPVQTNAEVKRIGRLIGLIGRQWRRVIDLRLQPFGLTEATWAPLVRLSRASAPMRQKDIAAALALDTSSVVRILKNLETDGLIERGADEQDGRAKAILLTEKGWDLVRRVSMVSNDLEQEALHGMDAGEVATTLSVLATISDRLADLGGKTETP